MTYPPATRCGHDLVNGDGAAAVGSGVARPSSRDCGRGDCCDIGVMPSCCCLVLVIV